MASAVRQYGPNDPRTRAARDNWRGESYLAAVAAAVADAPPLSPDQRDRLAVLLRPAAVAAEQRPGVQAVAS
ncbi:hypothetical protein EV378_1254 [Pseudonocardia endophytica]|uniref:Uncharacterized protein n=2 Tax=Pseudonocardia endophytica TaxID=401976 RepID=A0A4V2PIP2_PSEEN|nr:hypothetical protein EV378_1254 [Pseudonocardia endophytica]